MKTQCTFRKALSKCSKWVRCNVFIGMFVLFQLGHHCSAEEKLPPGSYSGSCTSCNVANNTLSCSCVGQGLSVNTSLYLSRGFNTKVQNCNGNLTYEGTCPAYTSTCLECALQNNSLSCSSCYDDQGSGWYTSLDLPCRTDIINCNANLICGKKCPAYAHSCFGCTLQSNKLSCMCNDEHGDWNGARTNLSLPCPANTTIWNCNGTLKCGSSCDNSCPEDQTLVNGKCQTCKGEWGSNIYNGKCITWGCGSSGDCEGSAHGPNCCYTPENGAHCSFQTGTDCGKVPSSGKGAQTPFKPSVSEKPGIQEKYNEHPASERPYERPEAPAYEKRPIENFEQKPLQRPEMFQEEQRNRMPMEERER